MLSSLKVGKEAIVPFLFIYLWGTKLWGEGGMVINQGDFHPPMILPATSSLIYISGWWVIFILSTKTAIYFNA